MVTYFFLGLALVFFSGMANGLHETLAYHPQKFFKRFPLANRQYWDPFFSWSNKYKNGNPANGPKYFLSTTLFVVFTDAKHLFDAFRMVFGFCGFFGLGQYCIDWPIAHVIGVFVLGWTAMQLGFHALYTLYFR